MNQLQVLLKYLYTPIHREGYLFITIFAVAALLLALLWDPLGWLGLIATAWCVYFFRNPNRVSPSDPSLILSPAEGLIEKVEPAHQPSELGTGEGPRTRISIFLSVFDVHVNRVPITGTVTRLHYIPGKFLNATLDKSSDENERQICEITTEEGKKIVFVQIAGLIARRIVCELAENQKVKAGETFGIIRFGSRVDVYLPEGVEPLVLEGQRAIGGETILADMSGGRKSTRKNTKTK